MIAGRLRRGVTGLVSHFSAGEATLLKAT
jgi:hypothetical protein